MFLYKSTSTKHLHFNLFPPASILLHCVYVEGCLRFPCVCPQDCTLYNEFEQYFKPSGCDGTIAFLIPELSFKLAIVVPSSGSNYCDTCHVPLGIEH